MNIWLDITTTLAWNRPALGIVRVEAETARHLLAIDDDRIRFCRFELECGNYFEVSRDAVASALARLDAGGHEQSAPAPSSRPAPLEPAAPAANAALSFESQLKRMTLGAIARLPHQHQARVRQLASSGHLLARNLLGSPAATATAKPEAAPAPRWPEHNASTQPFEVGDAYISLGLDWDQKNLPFIYALKKRLDLKVILFCYDIIPILMPEHCFPGVPEKFPTYFVDAAWCADVILCISECSRNDLNDYLVSVGAPVPNLGIVRLGGDIATPAALPPSPEVAEVISGKYILFVSTIEARKNHRILYQAYKKLLAAGKRDIPQLIFVGMQGWGVDDLIHSLQEDPEIHPYIRRLQNVSDSDLKHLYRHCLFTVYPSLYEGWGIPVAESLAYGKFCLASNAASIPEVGGDLVEYISPQDANAWADRLGWYSQNPQAICELQAVISNSYQSATWKETGTAIFNAALALQQSPPAAHQ